MVYRTFHFWKKPGLTKLLCRFVTSLNCCFDVVNFPNWGSLAELLDLGNRKHYTKLQWSVLQQSLLQLQLYSTTPLQENYNFNLTYNYTLYNHNCNLQPNYITLQLHLQDTRPTTRNYRCNYNCNCCNCDYNFNHRPLPLPLQQVELQLLTNYNYNHKYKAELQLFLFAF